ncbi:MAG: ATP-binding cassette domain-containing protein [Dehalococcoidia bacterium]|nr:ATP-binding cassette domain-containing protein [Dehalococcoidia bacterium]
MKAIKVKNLTKTFGHLVAVDHISFEVEEGEIFGFLGSNGAGKTTTMMMLATALNPTSGTATVCGYDIVAERNKIRKSIGILFEELSLDINLTGRENLDFHARIYQLDKKSREERMSRALELVGLRSKQNILVKYYSGGMQRRLEIARGMLNYPKVLFLDEPTLGLDVQTRRLLWDYAKRLNGESGTTILLSTHYVEEADYLCNRVAILEQGKIVVMATPQGLKDSLGGSLLSVKLSYGSTSDMAKLLREVSWVTRINQRDSWLELGIGSEGAKIPEIVRLAEGHGFAVSSISQYKPSLEDVFLHYVGKKLKDEKSA